MEVVEHISRTAAEGKVERSGGEEGCGRRQRSGEKERPDVEGGGRGGGSWGSEQRVRGGAFDALISTAGGVEVAQVRE